MDDERVGANVGEDEDARREPAGSVDERRRERIGQERGDFRRGRVFQADDAQRSFAVGDRFVEHFDQILHILEGLPPADDEDRVRILQRVEHNATLFRREHFRVKFRQDAVKHRSVDVAHHINFDRRVGDFRQLFDLLDHLFDAFEFRVGRVVDDNDVEFREDERNEVLNDADAGTTVFVRRGEVAERSVRRTERAQTAVLLVGDLTNRVRNVRSERGFERRNGRRDVREVRSEAFERRRGVRRQASDGGRLREVATEVADAAVQTEGRDRGRRRSAFEDLADFVRVAVLNRDETAHVPVRQRRLIHRAEQNEHLRTERGVAVERNRVALRVEIDVANANVRFVGRLTLDETIGRDLRRVGVELLEAGAEEANQRVLKLGRFAILRRVNVRGGAGDDGRGEARRRGRAAERLTSDANAGRLGRVDAVDRTKNAGRDARIRLAGREIRRINFERREVFLNGALQATVRVNDDRAELTVDAKRDFRNRRELAASERFDFVDARRKATIRNDFERRVFAGRDRRSGGARERRRERRSVGVGDFGAENDRFALRRQDRVIGVVSDANEVVAFRVVVRLVRSAAVATFVGRRRRDAVRRVFAFDETGGRDELIASGDVRVVIVPIELFQEIVDDVNRRFGAVNGDFVRFFVVAPKRLAPQRIREKATEVTAEERRVGFVRSRERLLNAAPVFRREIRAVGRGRRRRFRRFRGACVSGARLGRSGFRIGRRAILRSKIGVREREETAERDRDRRRAPNGERSSRRAFVGVATRPSVSPEKLSHLLLF